MLGVRRLAGLRQRTQTGETVFASHVAKEGKAEQKQI